MCGRDEGYVLVWWCLWFTDGYVLVMGLCLWFGVFHNESEDNPQRNREKKERDFEVVYDLEEGEDVVISGGEVGGVYHTAHTKEE